MLHTWFHAVGIRWLLVGMTVITGVLTGLVPVHGQQPPSGPASPQQLTSGQTSSTKNDPNAEVTVQDSWTNFRTRGSVHGLPGPFPESRRKESG
jgi:hypothetical protein